MLCHYKHLVPIIFLKNFNTDTAIDMMHPRTYALVHFGLVACNIKASKGNGENVLF
jgi:hypothetical protein